VETGRDGLDAKAGHDLLIDVMSWAATFNTGDHPSLEFSADPTSLRVREGTGGAKALRQEDKADIHGSIDMHVLKKRSISFRSSSIESWQGTLKIKADLEMGGTTKPISFELREQRGTLAGTVTLAQSESDIKPFSAHFGALRVKDEVKVSFDAALV
jgi:hypothetical protein